MRKNLAGKDFRRLAVCVMRAEWERGGMKMAETDRQARRFRLQLNWTPVQCIDRLLDVAQVLQVRNYAAAKQIIEAMHTFLDEHMERGAPGGQPG